MKPEERLRMAVDAFIGVNMTAHGKEGASVLSRSRRDTGNSAGNRISIAARLGVCLPETNEREEST